MFGTALAGGEGGEGPQEECLDAGAILMVLVAEKALSGYCT